MKELIKFLKYFLVSSILFIITSCDSDTDIINDVTISNEFEIDTAKANILTKDDSIKILARDLNIGFDEETDNVNDILDKILQSKLVLIQRLNSLDERADKMETLAYEYKKKEQKLEMRKLLTEISNIKKELGRIKLLAGERYKKNVTSIEEIKVPINTKTFENLPSGNYTTRIDRYYLLSIYVKPNGDVIIGQPRADSTTVIKGERKINPRLKKELEQIRKKLNKEFN